MMKQKRRNEQGCTRAAIIGWCICCIICKMSPAPCNTLYALFGAEQFYIMQTGNTDCMSRFNTKSEILYSTIFHRKSKTCEWKWHTVYSGTSIYRSCNDHFPACTVRHFWSQMKFHTNNIIYSRIHRSLNYRFTALIVCKSQSRCSISRMDRLKKKLRWSIYYLRYLLFGLQIWQHSNAVTPHTLPSVPRLRYQHQFGILLRCKWFCAFSCDS